MAKKGEAEVFSGISVILRAILDCKTIVHYLIACEHAQALVCCDDEQMRGV